MKGVAETTRSERVKALEPCPPAENSNRLPGANTPSKSETRSKVSHNPPPTAPSNASPRDTEWLIDETTKKFYLSLHTPVNPKTSKQNSEASQPVRKNNPTAPEVTSSGEIQREEIGYTLADRSETRAYIGIALVLLVSFALYEALSRAGSGARQPGPSHRFEMTAEKPGHAFASGPSGAVTNHNDPEPLIPADLASGAPSLTIAPGLILADIAPNQSQTYTLILNNLTSYEFTFELEGRDLILKDGKPVFRPAGEVYGGVAANLMFSKKTVNVKPMQSSSVEVTVMLIAPTDVRGVLIALKGSDPISLAGATEMTASLGTLISFARTQEASAQNAGAEGAKPAASKNFTLMQWVSNAEPECHIAGDGLASTATPAITEGSAAGGVQP